MTELPLDDTVFRRVVLFVVALCLACSLLGVPHATAAGKSRHHTTIRTARVHDTDTTASDGSFNLAWGLAKCKAHERVVNGWPILKGGAGIFGGPARVSEIASQKVPKKHGWEVDWNSDLGGAGSNLLAVAVECRT